MFLEDVVNLINRSPTLLRQIQAVDAFHLADGSTPAIYMPPTPGVSDDTSHHGASLFVRNLPGYDDSQTILTGGSLSNADDAVTPAGVFVGDLAHALGRWQDSGLQPAATGQLTALTSDAAGKLTGSTLQTDVGGAITNYVFRYAAAGIEDARAYDASNHLLYDRMIDLSGFSQFHDHYVVRQIQDGGRFNDIAGEQLTVIGNRNQIQGFSDIGLVVNGNNNSVGMVTGSISLHGNGNTIFPAFNDNGEPFDAVVAGKRNILSMDCGGNATLSGAGNVANIGSRPDDPHGLSDTNFIVSSTLGHTIFNAGMGNATLQGGLGGDTFNLTEGHSTLTTGSGAATVTGGGSDVIQGGTGGSDLYIAGNHSAEVISGFRPGEDHVSAGGQKVTHVVTSHGGTLITFSSGATINLIGVTDTGHLFG